MDNAPSAGDTSDHLEKNLQGQLEGTRPANDTQGLDFSAKTILGLAIPALGSLIIEPLLILIDSAMVGHLGVVPLAGLSLSSTVLNTLVGVFVFLAYSTTAVTARLFGEGNRGEGIRAGIQAIWLAAGLGVVLVLLLLATAPWIVGALGADAQVAPQATVYLRSGAFGMIGMLVILAANGVLRGLLDTRTPLYVLAAGAAFNVILNITLIYGLRLGLLGAGIGLSIAQTAMAAAMVWVVVRTAQQEGVSLTPTQSGVLSSVSAGTPLLIRTISLRIALLLTVSIAAQAGTVALAAHQVVSSLWSMAAFALDALAIAAQGLVGVALGRGMIGPLRQLIRRLSWWGVFSAVVIGGVMAALSPFLPILFGTDPAMHHVATAALLVAAASMPIGGLVFILDGVLIGASQGPYLARTGVITLLLYLPALWALRGWIAISAPLGEAGQKTALVWLWVAFAGWFMLTRAATNAWRAYRTEQLTH